MAGLLRKVLKLGKWMNGMAKVTLVFMVFITVGDVLLRSFRRPIPGTYELVALSGLVLIGFSLPFTSWAKGRWARMAKPVRVNVKVALCPRRT